MNATYRPMRTDDLPAAFAVRLSTVENAMTLERLESDYGITPQSLARAMKSDVKGWLCEEAGQVVGFAMGDLSKGEVGVVAVLPGHEGRGIGRNLLTLVQNWLFSESFDEIWLLADPDPSLRAHGFYRKLGWQPTGEFSKGNEVLKRRKAGPDHPD